MPIFRFFTVIMLLAMLTEPVLSKTHSSTSPNQTIQAIYNKMDGAANHKDVDAYLAFYDPNYTGYDIKGNHTDLRTFREQVKGIFSHAANFHATTTVQSAKQQGSGIVAIALTHWTLVIDDPKTGKPVTLKQVETDRDHWVKDSGAWRMRQERSLSIQVSENGTPVQ